MNIFKAICPTFGFKFAFHAKDQKDANDKMNKYNSYHSFTGSDKIYAVEKLYNVFGDHPIGKRVDEYRLTEEKSVKLVDKLKLINYEIRIEETEIQDSWIHDEYVD